MSLIHSSNFCFVTSVSLHKHLVRETFFDMAKEKPVIALTSCVKCSHERYTGVWREGTMCVIHIFYVEHITRANECGAWHMFFPPQELKTNSWPFKFANVHYNVANLSFFLFFLENDKPMKGLRQEDMVNQDLITELRKEFSMTHDDFYMVLTDTDMRVKVRSSSLSSSLSKRGGCCSESIKNIWIVGSKWVFIGHKPLLSQAYQGYLFFFVGPIGYCLWITAINLKDWHNL